MGYVRSRRFFLPQRAKIKRALQIHMGNIVINIEICWLPGWNDFQTLNWGEIYQYPEVILPQIQGLLQPALYRTI